MKESLFLFIFQVGGEGQGAFGFEKPPAGFTLNGSAEAHYRRPHTCSHFRAQWGLTSSINLARGGPRRWLETVLMRRPNGPGGTGPRAPGSASRQDAELLLLSGGATPLPAKAAPRSPRPSLGGQPVGPARRGDPCCLPGPEACFPGDFPGGSEGPQSSIKPVLGQSGGEAGAGARSPGFSPSSAA